MRTKSIYLGALLMLFTACERDINELSEATYSNNPDVFRDTFSAGLNYAAFGGSKLDAFQVDSDVTYNNSAASMRIEVPNVNDPQGAYAGGTYFTSTPRDLSGYNVLSCWIKASQPATIDVLGFGNDLGENKYMVSLNNVIVNTNWRKVYIPIPDAAKLKAERGMFYYSEGPENGFGYTIWIDEVKFENLGTLGQGYGSIENGQNKTLSIETNDVYTIQNMAATFNLPNGTDTTVGCTSSYFTFSSSASTIASVDSFGKVTALGTGSATVSASLGNLNTNGSLQITVTGPAILPTSPAPTPTVNSANVISMYSDAYTNVPINTWNTGWQFSTAQQSFIQIAGNNTIRYKSLNFVGVEFTSPVINATAMTTFHLDIWTPDAVNAGTQFKIKLVDFGANGVYSGGDDSEHEITVPASSLSSQNWISLNIPLSSFTGLTSRAHLAQLIFSGTLPNVLVDNVYFFQNATVPNTSAPVPTFSAGNVISVFSDTYTNIAGTNLNPNWGQSTIVSQQQISGNNTLKYTGLNYQGIQLGSNQNVSSMGFLRLNYWTANSTSLKVYLISPGPVETAYTLTVPTSGWNTVDIPLSAFSPVNLSNVIQLKFDGNGDIYLDNILFHN